MTIVAQGRLLQFGEAIADTIGLNPAGEMVTQTWLQIPDRFPQVQLDEFVVMPNHFHGILILTESLLPTVGASTRSIPTVDDSDGKGISSSSIDNHKISLGDVVGAFKSISTHRYIQGVKQKGWSKFDRRLWQRNYYERIIRDEHEFDRLREYILHNPLQWMEDAENPDNQ